MLVGYARSSTRDQEAGFEAQLRDLKAVGCEEIFSEMASSVSQRPALESALRFVRKGDTLVATKLDRLARSVPHFCKLIERLEAKGCAIRILNMNLDSSTPTGKLMLNVLASVAQFEREMMLERQCDGIAKAKEEGKYKGRAPTARAKAEEVMRLTAEGVSAADVATKLGIGRASVFRILKDQRAAA